MPGTFRRIDYRLRPAKHAERLMMADVFARLSRFESISEYQYVGLGSVYFADFSLFHRALGFRTMVNIEGAAHGIEQNRFRANAPVQIDLRFGMTTSELPKVAFDQRTVAWLDYDSRLEMDHLGDIAFFARKCQSGSVLAVSVQCEPTKSDVPGDRDAVEAIAAKIGPNFVPPSLRNEDLIGNGTAVVFRNAMALRLDQALKSRNLSAASPDLVFSAEQILNLVYADGLKMLTVAWVLIEERDRKTFDACDFKQFDFVRDSTAPFEIKVPKLTPREMRILQSQLPLAPGSALRCGTIPSSEASKFAAIYRYLPHYTTTDWA